MSQTPKMTKQATGKFRRIQGASFLVKLNLVAFCTLMVCMCMSAPPMDLGPPSISMLPDVEGKLMLKKVATQLQRSKKVAIQELQMINYKDERQKEARKGAALMAGGAALMVGSGAVVATPGAVAAAGAAGAALVVGAPFLLLASVAIVFAGYVVHGLHTR